MILVKILGLTAAALTTISFLPQVIRTWRLKETKDISLPMYLLFCSGVGLWLAYGLIIGDLPLIVANAVTAVLAFLILFFKIRYG